MEEYLVAGRRMPFYLVVPTIVATWFGAGSCMGVSGTVYSQGFYGVIADPFGCTLALIIAGLFFAAPFHRLHLITISDLLHNTYGPLFEKISTFLMIPFYIGTLASQMVAMGYVFHIVFPGVSPEIGIFIGSLIVVIYTVSGGIWAVTLTDFIQLFLIIIGLMMVLFICLKEVPQLNEVFRVFSHEFSSLLPQKSPSFYWLSYLGRIFMTGLGAIMGQDLIQRSIASRSPFVARYSAIVGGGIYMLLGLVPLFVGIAGRYILPNLENPEQLIPYLAKEYLSPIAFALFACGLLSAIMSTADGYLLAGTSLVSNNILLKIWSFKDEKSKIRLLRIVNVIIALVAFILALSGQTIYHLMVHSGATLFVAILIPVSAALFWKGANSISAWGSLFGGLISWGGFILYHPIQNYEDLLFSAATFGASFSLFIYIGISLGRRYLPWSITKKPVKL
ncbi:MAG: sodium:solute symporter family protein [Chlamydiae bacterium]|nr:sodium:solute symporter family protein [Chlamydiota bacterium]